MSIYLDGYYIDCADTLEEAKEVVDMYLFSKTVQLNELFTKKRFEDMQNEQILKDAQRYQYLRQQHWFSGSMCVVLNPKESIKLGSDT
ncbi:hypothetical protein NL462_27015, partial [Klebsiella pneumoniae]|nr:hypothetical protein [Klebsiella pneumoniae]